MSWVRYSVLMEQWLTQAVVGIICGLLIFGFLWLLSLGNERESRICEERLADLETVITNLKASVDGLEESILSEISSLEGQREFEQELSKRVHNSLYGTGVEATTSDRFPLDSGQRRELNLFYSLMALSGVVLSPEAVRILTDINRTLMDETSDTTSETLEAGLTDFHEQLRQDLGLN